MDSVQTKKMLMNVATVAVVLAVIGVGYWYFVGTKAPAPVEGVVTVPAQTSEQTVEVGNEITRTIKELDDLKSAVASSVDFFSKPAFRDLEDITVTVPSELVGRDNPFASTDWKLKQKALEEAAGKSAGGSVTQSAPAAPSGI